MDAGARCCWCAVAVVLLRPWEQLRLGGEPARSAWAYVLRAVDGDTIEVRL